MQISLISPLNALFKATVLCAVVYAVSAPALAPLRPGLIDEPLSRYHIAVNQSFAQARPTLRMVTEPLRLSPHYAKQRVAAMIEN